MKYFLILFLIPVSLMAQTNRTYTQVGIEPTTMLTIGYNKLTGLLQADHELSFYSELGISVFMPDIRNSDLKIGGNIELLDINSFKILNDTSISVGSVLTHNFESVKFAVANEIEIGFYRDTWFLSAVTEYEKIVINYLEHTQFYRNTFYASPVNGWYSGSGGNFQFGLKGGKTFNNTIDIMLEIKKGFSETFKSLASPLHINLQVGYLF